MKILPKKSDAPQEELFVIRDFPQLLAMVFALFFAAFALDVSTVRKPLTQPINHVAAAEMSQPVTSLPKATGSSKTKSAPTELSTAETAPKREESVIGKKARKKIVAKETVTPATVKKIPEVTLKKKRKNATETVVRLPQRVFVPQSQAEKRQMRPTAPEKLSVRPRAFLTVPDAVVFDFAVKENKYRLPVRDPEPLTKMKEETQADSSETVAEKQESIAQISADFRFSADLEKRPRLTASADYKSVYGSTAAGVLLQVKEAEIENKNSGIFVERSTDGRDFYSIGILNPAGTNSLTFFDGEASDADRHYYRFRTQNATNTEITFGDIICRQSRNLTLQNFRQSPQGIFTVDLHARFSGNITTELYNAADNRLIKMHSKRLSAGENKLDIALDTEAKLLKLTLKTGAEKLELLLEKDGTDITEITQSEPQVLPVSNKTTLFVNTSKLHRELLPLSIFDRNKEEKWEIPGLQNCPGMSLTVFNDWGLSVFHTENLTAENVWNGYKNGEKLPAGMYSYVLGAQGGRVMLI